jgi:hypothetical protein
MSSTSNRLRHIPFALASELREAAFNHGYHSDAGSSDGWLFFRSYTVDGEIALAASPEHWFVAVSHPGVAAELEAERTGLGPGDCRAAFVFADQAVMRAALSRIYQLSASLPTAPLRRFEDEIATLGETEAESLVRHRIGQNVFRRALLDYWHGRCPITGIEDPDLLRASHIVPWAKCSSDAERLDVHNGLLLTAHWDAAFDAGLVSFDDEGAPLWSPHISRTAKELLAASQTGSVSLTTLHRRRMAVHRVDVFRT